MGRVPSPLPSAIPMSCSFPAARSQSLEQCVCCMCVNTALSPQARLGCRKQRLMKRIAFPGEARQVSSSLLFLLERNIFDSPRLNKEVCMEEKT